MKFSVIVPSYNQDKFIGQTLKNLKEIKELAMQNACELEILVFDSESNSAVQEVLKTYRGTIDYLEVKKDAGQYDAINKGLARCSGDYWTWLNTDDLLDKNGFLNTLENLRAGQNIDYVYGSIQYMDEKNQPMKTIRSWPLDLKQLVSSSPSVFQPGSWFRKGFTDSCGFLSTYQCCFDYEYICRLMTRGAKFKQLEITVAQFRYYPQSKSGSIVKKFVEEQWLISKIYGRKWYNFLTFTLALRRLKHSLFS